MEGPQREHPAESGAPDPSEDLSGFLAALSEAACKMSGLPDLGSAAELFLSTLRSHLGCRRAVLTQTDEEGRDHRWFFAGLTDAEIDLFHAHRPAAQVRDACLVEKYRTGRSYSVPAAEYPGLETPRPAAGRGSRGAAARELLLVPLRGAGGRLLGTLLVDDGHRRGTRDPAAVAALELLATQMSRALELSQLDLSARNAQLRLRKAEEQLMQSEKLSAIGQLISGVAHELNNPLSGVMGFTQMLQAGESNPKVRQSLDRIYNEAARCQKIVQNLLSFARRHQSEKSARSLNDVIESVLDLRAYQLQVDDIEVERRYDPDLPQTMLDFHQLQQVVLNLVNNAHQAMMATSARPRRLTIVTECREDRLCAAFSDTGPGISQDRMSRIFEPFFTTKEPGKGTGLGLSVSLGIIRSHQGTMSVDSAVGAGSTFRFELPLVECSRAEKPAAEPAPPAATPARGLRLLVVDDEEVLTALLTDLLKSAGHEVDQARDGRTALAMALEHSYDAVLTDLKMPGLDGQGLYVALCQSRPEMRHRFIFSTGDLANPQVQTFFQESGCACLSKPFKLETVLRIVEQIGSQRRAA